MSMRRLLASTEVLNLLKQRYRQPNALSLDDLYKNHNKTVELIWAVRDDDADEVLKILTTRDNRTPGNHTFTVIGWSNLPSGFITTLLSIAAMIGSVRVYTAVCPMLTPELDEIILVTQDNVEYLRQYLEQITFYTLKSSNADIYKAFFSALSQCDAGLEEVFWEGAGGPDDVGKDMFESYAHYLMTGDDSALKVMQSYFPHEQVEQNLLEGCKYIRSLDFAHWLIENRSYSKAQLGTIIHRSWTMCAINYLDGKISYEEAKELELENQEIELSYLISNLKAFKELKE